MQKLVHLLHTKPFTHKLVFNKLWSRASFTERYFYTHAGAFRHRRFYTQSHLHTDACTQKLLHTEISYTQNLFNTKAKTFAHKKVHAAQKAFTQGYFYTHTVTYCTFYAQVLLYKNFYTENLLITHRSFYAKAFTHI